VEDCGFACLDPPAQAINAATDAIAIAFVTGVLPSLVRQT
jgi:hypothetical protein